MEIRSDLGGVIFFGGVTRDVWERFAGSGCEWLRGVQNHVSPGARG